MHPDQTIAIVIAQGTDATGTEQELRTRYHRGPVMREAIERNQLSFALISPEDFPPEEQLQGPATWLLLYYIDRNAEEIRLELSLPQRMDKLGYVVSWRERVMLPPLAIEPLPPIRAEQDDGEDEDYDVRVTPRTG